ncbi:permease of the major facilitator superfamily [Meredithblackwellia eburnea MCA 4105]
MTQDSAAKEQQETVKQEHSHVESHLHHKFNPTQKELKDGDKALELSADHVVVTEADSRRICRLNDYHILSALCLIYWLQVLDKNIIGVTAVFNLKKDIHLVGNEYSTISSIGPYAQIAAQPLGAYLLVRFPVRKLVPILVFCWGASMAGMTAVTDFKGMVAARFFLGWFEASCIPLFQIITVAWYRRAEQPIRVAAWYGTNGLGTIAGALIGWGASHAHTKLHTYQIAFMVCGLLTVIISPMLYFWLDNSPVTARFLSEEDRAKSVERLRANQTGMVNYEFKWAHIQELAIDPKTYLFAILTVLSNIAPNVSNTFGPIILSSIAGMSPSNTVLMNIPFGCMQVVAILSAAWLSYKINSKSIVFALSTIPPIIGTALLYTLPHVKSNVGPLLFGYYLLAFNFAVQPLTYAWVAANTAGQTKKAALVSLCAACSSAGNIIGPNLFKVKDAPNYKPALAGVLGITCAVLALIGMVVLTLMWLNKKKEQERVKNGKPAKLKDLSMSHGFETAAITDDSLGENAFLDLTDFANDEMVYVY